RITGDVDRQAFWESALEILDGDPDIDGDPFRRDLVRQLQRGDAHLYADRWAHLSPGNHDPLVEREEAAPHMETR
ncbi:MAG: hypothetical protein R3185_01745, partial [Candidatus Thermoplasmatota archaeon]|nr:hypothetical protein [Candidatus Thermoplasmatota archaeon]